MWTTYKEDNLNKALMLFKSHDYKHPVLKKFILIMMKQKRVMTGKPAFAV